MNFARCLRPLLLKKHMRHSYLAKQKSATLTWRKFGDLYILKQKQPAPNPWKVGLKRRYKNPILTSRLGTGREVAPRVSIAGGVIGLILVTLARGGDNGRHGFSCIFPFLNEELKNPRILKITGYFDWW